MAKAKQQEKAPVEEKKAVVSPEPVEEEKPRRVSDRTLEEALYRHLRHLGLEASIGHARGIIRMVRAADGGEDQ